MTPDSLIAWRKRLGLTQAEAAFALGCGLRSITNWEGGDSEIPRYIALACAAIKRRMKPLK